MIQLDSTEARKFAVHLEGYEGLGGELVKNGDFSQIGDDVVENGGFDELGTDVITNGDFTATPLGSDTIYNGDFADTSTTLGDVGSGWSLPDGAAEYTTFEGDTGVKIIVGASGDSKLRAKTVGGDNVVLDNTSYKLTYTVLENNGVASFRIFASGSVAIPYTVDTHTVYFTTTETNVVLQFINDTHNSDITITDVICEEDINLITNGDFSATGSELVVNGAFLNGTDDWTEVNTATISIGTHEGRTDVADININTTLNSERITQPFSFVDGKSYKVTVDVYLVSGSFRVDSSESYVVGDFVSTTTTDEWQTLTGYITAISSVTSTIFLRSITEVSQFYVDSVSIKELGEGWLLNQSPYVGGILFNGSGLSLDSSDIDTSGSGGGLTYSGASVDGTIFEIGKSYKLVIEDLDITSGQIELKFGRDHASTPQRPMLTAADNGTYTEYFTAQTTNDSFTINSNGGTVATIGSITVQELGEDWTQGNGWTIGDSKAISAQGLGGELITNGDFSEGVEQLTQPIDLTVDFIANSGGVIDDSNSFTTVGGTFDGIKNTTGAFPTGETLQVGKSYKLVIEGSTTSSGFTIGRLTISGNEYGVGFGTHYFTLLEVGIWIRQQTSGTTDLTTFTIEELGEGWTFVGVDATNTISIESGGARVVSVGTNISLRQTFLEEGKHYKLTCNTTITTGALGLDSYSAGITTNLTEGANVVYFTATSNLFIIKRITGTDNVLIDNISVEEIATSYLTQAGVLTADKTWKVIYAAVVSAGTVSATEWGAVTSATATVTDYVQVGTTTDFRMVNIDGYFEGSVTGISAELVDPLGYWTLEDGWSFGEDKAIATAGVSGKIRQTINLSGKWAKVTFTMSDYGGAGYCKVDFGSTTSDAIDEDGTHIVYGKYDINYFELWRNSDFSGSITNISVEQLDPNDYWTLESGWTIGDNKAIADATDNLDMSQDCFSLNETYVVSINPSDLEVGGKFLVSDGAFTDLQTITSNGVQAVHLNTTTNTLLNIRGKGYSFNITDISARLINTGAVTLTLINQLTEKETIVELTPLASNGRYTEFSYQPTDLIEGMYLIKFTGDSTTYAETLAYITTGTPPLGESEYTEYTTGDDNPDHVYIP